MKKFENALIYTEEHGLIKSNLVFGEKIESLTDGDGETISIPEGAMVVPGFVDMHIHGAGGSDAMDASDEALANIANTVAREGTTTFLATTMTQSVENIIAALSAVKEYISAKHDTGAEIAGVHLEGPFIAASHKGAQPGEYIAVPDVAVFDKYNEAAGGNIKVVTLAAEIEEAEKLISHLNANGIVASIGHSSAKYADVAAAVSAGARSVTHTYNAQSPLHHREIGVVGSAMLFDELNCELIADTIHVSVPAMKLLVKNKPYEKLTLITDAMRAKGLPDGESELGGQKVFVQNGEARLADGTLAGSVLKMNVALKNLTEKVGVPLSRAIECATANPAKILGIYNEVGSIKEGKRANLTVLDKEFNVIMTIRNGKTIYQA